MGSVLTGVWVLAHEAGHQAFSPSRYYNDAVGLVLHSALLVPYHSWRISHGHHHSNTCSIENDEVFVPLSVPSVADLAHTAEADFEAPIVTLFGLLWVLAVGWPAYLVANVSGPAKYAGARNSHFDPKSALFNPDTQGGQVALSDAGVLVTLAALAYSCATAGAGRVAAYYGVPYLVVNSMLVLITYLQHTDEYVPHYRAGAFTWLRGALSTVDRSFGRMMDAATHHITDSHVVHHLFSTMPW